MSLRDKLKLKFLKAVEDGGIREVKGLIAAGKVKKDEPVNLEKELTEAKAKVGSTGDILGVTDNDLREVIKRVCKKRGLEVKDGSQ